MNTIALYIIVYIIEGIIFGHYCSVMMTPRRSFSIRCIMFAAGYALCFLCSFMNSFIINTSVFLLINFLLLYFLYDIKCLSAVLHVFFITVMMWCGELLVVAIDSQFLPSLYSGTSVSSDTTILSVFSKFLYFFFLQILIFVFHREKTSRRTLRNPTLFLFFVPVLSTIIFLALASACYLMVLPESLNLIFLIVSLLVLVMNILVFATHRQTQNAYQEYTQLQLQLQKEEDLSVYYRSLQQQDEQQKILLHDIKNHLHTLRDMASEHQCDDIVSYLNTLDDSAAYRMPVRISDNENLNAIVSRYIRRAEEQGISFLTDIRSQMLMHFDYLDMTALLCNLLDNALAAAAGTSDKQMTLCIAPADRSVYTIIAVTNSCASNPFRADGTLPGQKSSSRHGYGLKSVQRIAEKYDGLMDMKYKDTAAGGEFYVLVMMDADADVSERES